MSEETVYKVQVEDLKEGKRSWLPWLLIGAGALFLFANLANIFLFEFIWPVLLIGPGLLMLWPAYRMTAEKRQPLAFLAIPGAFFVGLGGLLLLTALSGHWQSWAYAWLLLPAALVAGIQYMKRFEPDSSVHRSGQRVIRALVMAFMGLAILFEAFLFPGNEEWWPVLLIGLGVYLWARNRK